MKKFCTTSILIFTILQTLASGVKTGLVVRSDNTHAAFSKERVEQRLGEKIVRFTDDDLDAIKNFSKSGGKLVVAYSKSKELADFMGVEIAPYVHKDILAMGDVNGNVLCTYRTGSILEPRVPANNRLHAKVAAILLDENLRPSGINGAVETDRGIWYAHAVPPSSIDGRKLAKFPGSMPVVGVWSRGEALDAKGWPATAAQLAATGINTIFLLESAKNFDEAANACRKAGLRVHAWIISFTDKDGPDSEEARKALVRKTVKLARKKNIDGIHLDYFRYRPGALKGVEQRKKGAKTLTGLLSRIHRAVASQSRGIKISAAVFPRPRSQLSVGQDITKWTKSGLVDFVCPMSYTNSKTQFIEWAKENIAASSRRKVAMGIGSYANESRLDAKEIHAQVMAAAKLKMHGAVIFILDAELKSRLRK